MSAITMPQQRQFNFLPVALGFVLLAIFFVVYGNHAYDKHQDDAVIVRQCVSNGGTIQLWSNPTTGRKAQVCQVDAETFGVMIEESGREVTSFVKDKMRRLEQVQRYLANRGYLQQP